VRKREESGELSQSRLSLLGIGAFDLILLQLAVEGGFANSEGAGSGLLVAIGLKQGA
jgi:hypothetical protein